MKHCSFLPGLRSRTPSASSSVFEGPEVRLGERVLVVGQRTGVVQFYGNTSFAPGQLSKLMLCKQITTLIIAKTNFISKTRW